MKWFTELDRLKQIMLRNFVMSLAAYHIALLISYLSIAMGLSFYNSTPFNYLLVAIYLSNGLFLTVNLTRQQITKSFSNRMLTLQIANWFVLFSVWSFFMVSQRATILLCAMMVLAFLFAYSTLIYSILLTLSVSAGYLLTAFIGMSYFEHPINMREEVLYVIAFFFSAVLVGLLLHRLSTLLRNQASNDFLTKLLNRRAMVKYINKEFQRSQRFKTPSTLVMMDLDDFKKINDTYGHDGGDIVLIKVANILKRELRDIDYLARWGGEEYLALLIGVTPEQAKIPIQRVLNQLTATPVKFDNQLISVSFSAGMCSLTQGESVQASIQEADRLLYVAKSEGKSRVFSGS